MRSAYATYKAMLDALAAGTATPEQQRAAFKHLQSVKRQLVKELLQTDRDARDAYEEVRWNRRE